MVKETRDQGEGEGAGPMERRNGYLFGGGDDKGLPLDRGETDLTHRQMAIYKGKRGNPMLG